jgi:RNA polymerase sigma factor for flagellar operon FliA
MLQNEDLILENLDLVEDIVISFINKYIGFYNINDLKGFGYWGLIQAADRYKPNKNDNFKNYAKKRIFGSIIDGLRKDFDFRTKSEKELPLSLYSILKNNNFQFDNDTEVNEDNYIDKNWKKQYEEVIYKFSSLTEALNQLSEREKDMIDMYYDQGYYYKEIGEKYKISESGAYWIISNAIKKIKNKFGDKILEERMVV